MSVEVAGGEAVLVFVMFTLEFTSVAGVPSMNQVISVSGILNSVILTDKMSGVPVDTLESLGAKMTGPTVENDGIINTGIASIVSFSITSLNNVNRRGVYAKSA